MKKDVFVATALILILCVVASQGQATKKKSNKSGGLETARIWHMEVVKDEILGDRITYYLPSVEDTTVYLLLVCPSGHAQGMTSLQFPFTLYGIPNAEITYKLASGEVKHLEFGLTDARNAMVAGRVDAFRPLIGAAFRVEDGGGTQHTYHMPAVGTEPFDTGCKP